MRVLPSVKGGKARKLSLESLITTIVEPEVELKPPSQRAHPQCQTFRPEFCPGLQQASAPTSTPGKCVSRQGPCVNHPRAKHVYVRTQSRRGTKHHTRVPNVFEFCSNETCWIISHERAA